MLKEVYCKFATACFCKCSQKGALSTFSASFRAKPIIFLGTKEKASYTAYIFKGCVRDICLQDLLSGEELLGMRTEYKHVHLNLDVKLGVAE